MYQDKKEIDMVAVIRKYIPLRSAGSTKFSGPCPFCITNNLTGDDRFSVKPQLYMWNCNKCMNGKWHDIITFIQMIEGLNYLDTCSLLNLDPKREDVRQDFTDNLNTIQPAADWVKAAWEKIEEAEYNLYKNEKALSWLYNKRGLTDKTIKEFRLGFFDQEQTLLSLPDGSDVVIPRGILIPGIAVDGTLWGLKVASGAEVSTKKLRKYYFVQFSRAALHGKVSNKRPLLIVEGEFDMILAYQEAGDRLDVVTLGGAGNKLPARWLQYINYHNPIAVMYDNDQAGQEGARHWDFLGSRLMNPVPKLTVGKDIGEFVLTHGCSFSAWVDNILLKSVKPIGKVVKPKMTEPTHVLAEQLVVPKRINTTVLKEEIIDEIEHEPASLADLKQIFNCDEVVPIFNELKSEGYLIISKNGVCSLNPVFKKHESLAAQSAIKLADKPYWICTVCTKLDWRSDLEGEWFCGNCGSTPEAPTQWATTADQLRKAKKPVFGSV